MKRRRRTESLQGTVRPPPCRTEHKSGFRVSYHGLLVGGAGDGHSTAGALGLLGELDVHLPVVLGDQAVVEVVVLHLQEDGLSVHVLAGLQEVHHLGRDEHAVGVYGLHRNEAGIGVEWWEKEKSEIRHSFQSFGTNLSPTHNTQQQYN